MYITELELFFHLEILGCFENDYRHDVLEFGRYKVYPNGEHECEDFCLRYHQNNFKYYGLQVCIVLGNKVSMYDAVCTRIQTKWRRVYIALSSVKLQLR